MSLSRTRFTTDDPSAALCVLIEQLSKQGVEQGEDAGMVLYSLDSKVVTGIILPSKFSWTMWVPGTRNFLC